MLNSTAVSSLAFLLIAAGAWQMAGSLTEMGAFFPQVIAAMLGLFSLMQLAISIFQKKKETPFAGIEVPRVVMMLLGIAVYVGLMTLVGYILSGIIFLAFFIWYLNSNGSSAPVVKAILLAIAINAAFYLVFHYIFLVPLPEGLIFGG